MARRRARGHGRGAGGGREGIASPPFDLDNRGKRSVVLDRRTDDGRTALHRLLASADVFVTDRRQDGSALVAELDG